MTTKFSFPAFRKYSDEKTFFKISSSENFEELKILGKYYTLHNFNAKILPDRNFISDLLECATSGILIFTEDKWNNILEECKTSMIKTDF